MPRFSRRKGLIRPVLAMLLLGSSLSAHAITYSYTGNQFDFAGSDITTPCDPGTGGCLIDSVTVSLDFAAPLGANLALATVSPDAWSISDGLTTITDMTPGIAMTGFLFSMQVGTDGSGNIDEWLIDINPTDPNTVSAGEWSGTRTRNFIDGTDDQTRYCQAGSCSNQGLAIVNDNPGVWTVIPLPAGIWLFIGALGALLGLRRR